MKPCDGRNRSKTLESQPFSAGFEPLSQQNEVRRSISGHGRIGDFGGVMKSTMRIGEMVYEAPIMGSVPLKSSRNPLKLIENPTKSFEN